jgi:hypothetical protein
MHVVKLQSGDTDLSDVSLPSGKYISIEICHSVAV